MYQQEIGGVDPISVGEALAHSQDWSCDRLGEDSVAIVVDGKWRVLFLAMMWSQSEGLIRLTSSFDLKPRAGHVLDLLGAINRVNECCWEGAFTLCSEQELVVYRNVLVFDERNAGNWRHIDRLLTTAIDRCERFYPVLQAVNLGNSSFSGLLKLALSEPVGHS
ncbi:MAG: YbjN domain-containing protein [Rhodobacteraceae bacterium]|nr:YbjN domain-containing protein [Paracoccaceae bacterium]